MRQFAQVEVRGHPDLESSRPLPRQPKSHAAITKPATAGDEQLLSSYLDCSCTLDSVIRPLVQVAFPPKSRVAYPILPRALRWRRLSATRSTSLISYPSA